MADNGKRKSHHRKSKVSVGSDNIEVVVNQPNDKQIKKERKKSKKPVLDPIMMGLENVIEVIINQESDILEAITGCQKPNNYHIYGKDKNGELTYLFKCREYSGCCMRFFCPVDCREFEMKIKPDESEEEADDNYEDSYLYIEKPLRCPCLCFARPVMNVTFCSDNAILGKIKSVFSCCDPQFEVYNNKDECLFFISADCCQCGLLCRNNFLGKTDEAHFFIYEPQQTYNPIGDICKKAAESLFSIADNYKVIMPLNANPMEKLLLIVAGIMIDYQFFEKNTNAAK